MKNSSIVNTNFKYWFRWFINFFQRLFLNFKKNLNFIWKLWTKFSLKLNLWRVKNNYHKFVEYSINIAFIVIIIMPIFVSSCLWAILKSSFKNG